MGDHIFVSVASYCDPLLDATLLSALSSARWPERLRFGVVDQSREPHRLRSAPKEMRERVRYAQLDPLDARGPCWARAIGMSLHRGEPWFLQIDSHMLFAPGWDEALLDWGRWAAARNPHWIISTYPNPFVMRNGQAECQTVSDKVLAQVVRGDSDLTDAHPVLLFEAVPVNTDAPLPAFHVAAGCLFAPGCITQQLPYDPFLYFHGEEQSMALRAYTHGWDLWHVPGMPMWHEYVHGPSNRPLQPVDELDAERGQRSTALDHAAQQRLAALLYRAEGLGVYGLGTQRTLASYADFSGIDYASRRVAPHARKLRHGY